MADFTPYLSCTRASTGYAQTAAGALTSFAANVLRRTDKGLLVEEARTNILVRSQELNTSWTYDATVTITADAIVAPDGTTTAETFSDGTSGPNHHRIYQIVTPGAGSATYSIYAKAGTGTWFQITMQDGGGTPAYYANFNVATGALGSKDAGAISRIEALANGWYRCSVTGTLSASGQYIFISMAIADTASFNPSYTGINATIHFWGAQVEGGASYPTSYIPTTTAAVTRAADAVALVGTADTILDGAAGSAVISMDVIPRPGFHAISSADPAIFYATAEGHIRNWSGTADITKSGLAGHVTNASKYGLAWSAAGRSLTGQGLAVATDAAGRTVPGAWYLGGAPGAGWVDTYIRRLSLWNSRLADADLVTETT